jgi:hypothetical protein
MWRHTAATVDRERRPCPMTISLAWAYTAGRGWHLIAAPPDWLPDEWDTQTDAGRQPRDTADLLADLLARDGIDAVADQFTTELRRRDGYDHPAPSAPRPDLRVVA